ncbi:hypothetical protein PMG11_07023 [Penicillium brasilianum]|uniref:FAD-binding FR-type domain-containing protein n=1 Tax=Penicillium brasilianum TaxID=104259 RepID=A0A0F7TSF5_PENBI|nr:hypothetical protein PMG11_07023 [Penicillium brasilianum]
MAPVAVKLSHWLSGVSLPGKYGLCAALILLACVSYHIGRDCLAWSLKLQRAVSWRRFLQSPVPSILYYLDILSYIKCLLLVALLTSNVVVLVFAAQSFTEVQRRAGSMAVIYLFPLFASPTFSQTSSLCRLSRDTLAWAHRWVGRVCLIHCVLHGTIILELTRQYAPLSGPLVAAFRAAVSFLAMLPVTLAVILRRHPQLMLKLHYLLAVSGAAFLAYHLRITRSVYFWVLVGGVSLWAVLCVALWAQTMCALRSWRDIRLQAEAKASKQLLWVEISVPLQWNIQAGQHIQLWMPCSGYRSYFHLPLFYVANVGEQQPQKGRSTYRRLHCLVRYRHGLTKRLAVDAIKANCSFPVFIFGPFGHPPCFGDYGTVLFVVEDIGLFRILPFIQQLVQGSRRRETVVRKLEILWAVDWSSILELELLVEPRGADASISANHVPEIERSRYKLWIWNSVQRLFELDRQRNHALDSGDTQAAMSSASRLGKTGGFDVSVCSFR